LTLSIQESPEGFFVVRDTGYGFTLTGPYRRKQDAKGVLTRIQKQDG
jgi:hypothetical protein